jgi:transcription elongation factor Elf1
MHNDIRYTDSIETSFGYDDAHDTDCSDEKARIGYLSCKICGQKFSADTNPLDQPIDVYSLWIDACEDVANEQER